MRFHRPWVYLAVSIPLGAILAYWAIAEIRSDYGNVFPVFALFPWFILTALIGALVGIGKLAICVCFIQMPLYSLILSAHVARGRLRAGILGVLVAHALGLALTLALIGSGFLSLVILE